MQRTFLLIFILLACVPVWAANHCVILQYHHFGDQTPAITSVSLQQFDDHLQYLEANDFNILPLRDVVTALQHNKELPDRCVSLSVDDAYISVYKNAFPRIKKRRWPLTVFVNTEGVDKGSSLYMTWDHMRELSLQGVTFENHGHGHIHMIRKDGNESDKDWRQRVTTDIGTAQRRITEEIGIPPQLFAHPYGEYNPVTLAIIKNMGLSGFGQQSGPAWPGADFGVLPRFPMAANHASLQSFKTKVNTLPFPVVSAEPSDPLVPLRQKRPALELTLAAGTAAKSSILCFIDGSNDVYISWSKDSADKLTVAPAFDLGPGRHRTNCSMSSGRKGRFHWYSHNWFVRKADGSWYAEY